MTNSMLDGGEPVCSFAFYQSANSLLNECFAFPVGIGGASSRMMTEAGLIWNVQW